MPRPNILKEHSHLINAFKSGMTAIHKRRLEHAYTEKGSRTVFTKEAFGLGYTNGEIFGTFGWNSPDHELKDMTNFFPEFQKFTETDYYQWASDDASPETFKRMESLAIDTLKQDLAEMYAKLKPEILGAMSLIKTALFGSDEYEVGAVGTKRKLSYDKDAIYAFTDNNKTAITDIKSLREICSYAEKYIVMTAINELPLEG
jgi:hypothetical protein